ncbi:hypothetical protein BMS3Abin05_02183 [bacterium BMS3Abin05]|nr:hypothetical protein BMS3Abin05_02183 [bacterium BMS3Abin05]GBE28400.1 hypothetical protein BMS3Bbin03_02339 [bacterium BMS3Bbin03]HDL78846.1 hypothetical protein [Bacteroidota bacterium]HDZ12981.1 hypothetical protein [Bacteroidota bacterium]
MAESSSKYTQPKRILPDRRKKATNPFHLRFWCGRRVVNRRQSDGQTNYYVDRYSLRSSLIVIWIVLLSVADSFFTLVLLQHGAVEINPIMRLTLKFGTYPFFFIKYFLTIFSVILLLIHKNFYFLNGKISLKNVIIGMAGAYTILVIYEILLFWQTCLI